ncbi:branched-chain amino acid transporter permease [Plasticicumulans sp.]|uniref:branched-chain amino acid transporter permease n=1 Tax=Plasticicumulans sp. TaxID=2307179 RepID=UPI000FB3E3EC|nr:AzlD domain-containing protein [Plasticicumulans sp.]MBS0599900.1 AzlD domain-containing protein [Pseudomonadota bacterium]RTL03301.1 MAG: branched-chain amino acid ABC transporter [Xanthomonadales bacterium]HMW30199.1 AzlD domain-containing protein [Plasticicumulans sp.]HMW42967.1 AzlD domain-containing protein [Plasticicumulans sp.]HMX54682.1 AzlD domain-containing protein [Plasticicumulans sp.]
MSYVLAAVALMALATFATRAAPFLLFAGAGERPWLRFLARYLPPAVMTVLVLYCLRDTFTSGAPGPLPALAGVVVTVAVHLARRNALLSIAAGTALHMLLLR